MICEKSLKPCWSRFFLYKYLNSIEKVEINFQFLFFFKKKKPGFFQCFPLANECACVAPNVAHSIQTIKPKKIKKKIKKSKQQYLNQRSSVILKVKQTSNANSKNW